MLEDEPSAADTGDRRACPPRLLHIHGRMYLRNADTAPPLPVVGETSSEHGANSLWTLPAYQKPFDGDASAIEAGVDASDLAGMEVPAGCTLGMGKAD